MYTVTNFKTKKALKEALANGDNVEVYAPGLGTNGTETVNLEGPHYPAPHTWYAVGTIKNGKLVKVK